MAVLNGTDNSDLMLNLLGLGDDVINGGAGADLIVGNLGDDVVNGGTGADVIIGGVLNLIGNTGTILDGGNDTATYADSSAGVQIDLYNLQLLNVSLLGISLSAVNGAVGHGGDAEGDVLLGINNLTGSAFDDRLIGNDLVNSLIGNAGADVLYGKGGDDALTGGAGDDKLVGGVGADHLVGGDGSDWAYYHEATAGVIASLATGAGTGGEAAGDTFDSIENLWGSTFADTLTGDNGANTLFGNDGNDVLSGGGGDDLLEGGNGNDTLNGDAGADAMYGGAGIDIINGGAGDDRLVGGAGADTLNGGDGSDTAYYHTSTSAVNVNLAANTGTGGEAAGDTYNSIENVYGSSFNDTLTGDAGANTLSGANGNDTLNGGGGDDTLVGGNGIDSLNGDGGSDGIYGGFGTDTLNGGDGDDRLVGGAGADVLNGGTGSDWAYYHSSAAGVTADLATNTGTGGDAQGDTYISIENLYGSTHDDTLIGDGGTNSLLGNTGADTLTGGGRNDFFVFRDLTDSTVALSGRDTITDFSHAEGDKIDLRPLDADGNPANGDTAFTFVAGGAFTGGLHELVVQGSAGSYTVLGDVNGDKVADFAIDVHSATALDASDFLL